MTAALQPASLAELTEAVRSTPRLLAVGAGTKPRLAAVDAVKLSMLRLSGVTEYAPEEFTFTALAGTPLREIVGTLAQRGQYLPFDPPLVEAGATLGGTVAAGLNGPGRFRFGGIRDFILGVRFVDGAGRLLRAGGKVVKNAAGFDLPKFFTGSLGRFGVLAELTFKVFPRPASVVTLQLTVRGPDEAVRILTETARSRWECDAIDLWPDGRRIWVRLAGPAAALDALAREVFARWPGETISEEGAAAGWAELREFGWAHGKGLLVKTALTPVAWPDLERKLRAFDRAKAHVSIGGNVAFVSLPSAAEARRLDESLRALGLAGLTLRGEGPLWLGARAPSKIAGAVKQALDVEQRFPGIDD